ncbi:uncharacterized protein LOC144881025 [Branchiostoma floridae x Branchiostoma japonicum]
MPSRCTKTLMNLRRRWQILKEGLERAHVKFEFPEMVIFGGVKFLGLVVFMLCCGVVAFLPVEYPPTSTLLETLALDIPSDGHLTNICLHDGKSTKCMPMMRWGNITLNITSERSTSETGLDVILTAGLAYILLWSLAFILLLILGIWAVCSECNWIQIFCPKSACTRMATYTIEDPESCAIEIPTAEDMIKTISHEVQSLEEPLDLEGQIHQPGAIPEPMLDNPCFEDSETTCEGKASEGKLEIKSSSFEQKENKTILKLKTEKRIDAHNGSPQFIQAISERMVGIESLVNPTALNESVIPKKYDCFIIYSGHNADFVCNSIIPHLDETNITYCEHQRHFIPGHDIFSNIQACISESSKILAVLSADFFGSGWCCKDLDMAMAYAVEKQIESFIVPIKIDDCVIPDRYSDLKDITYSDLTNCYSPNEWGVWEQIRGSLASIHVATIKLEIHMCPKGLQKAYNISTGNTWM